MIGLNVGIPAAGLCICRRLYHIASLKSMSVTEADKRRNVIVDLSIGLGLPVLEMVLHYIVQGHRFNIYEGVGCIPSTYATWPALLIIFIPPILIGLASAIYATLNIVHFREISKKCADFPGHSNLTSSRYLRFLYLSGSEILCTIPLASYNTFVASSQLSPWISWADTHADFSRVDVIPAVLWRSNRHVEGNIELSRWLVVFCAFVFFAFFGLTDEARRNYRSCIQAITTRLGLTFTSTAPRIPPLVFQPPARVHNLSDTSSKMTDLFFSIDHCDHRSMEEDCEKAQISTSLCQDDGRTSASLVLQCTRPSSPGARL
ncbi:hypothetical protein CVT25_004140 [Psilocybe cyanescens]|uniref:Uncharacterized protein n=1 Tax=Psilocybe cyanescens TaxID=93625 RepID=A0A409XKS0_PSICY|nr:hypothetical protein CVT25_004140 [Psilocybe cyanescens]